MLGSTIVTAWFFEQLVAHGERPALIWRDQEISYRQLVERKAAWRERLAGAGLGAGQSVALRSDYSPETVALLLALVENGSIAVPFSRRGGAIRERFLELAEVDAVIDIDDADAFTLAERRPARTSPLLERLRAAAEPGLVVFTSGSTGESKGIVHSFARVAERFRRPPPPLRSITFLLLDHFGGINTLWGILSGGGAAISIAERTPEAICAAVERWRVELLPTSPTFLNMLLMSGVYRRHDLGSLKLITYGTEPMLESTLKRLGEVFPQVRLKQTYGLSELGVLSTRSRARGSLWLSLGGDGFETRVVNGVLFIRSASAMLGYLDHPSPFDAEGWYDTGDLVDVDGEWLRFRGRTSDVINVGGQKVLPTEVEEVIAQMDNVDDVTVRGRPNPVTGQVVCATITVKTPEDPDALRQRVRAFCQERLPRHKVPMLVELGELKTSARFKKVRT